MKHLLLEIVEVTEAAALAASKYVGSGEKYLIDKVATEAMQSRFKQIPMNGEVVIGEGKKDGSVGLYKGERIGAWSSNGKLLPYYDIALDPVDGTTQVAKGGTEAMSVIAVGGQDCLFSTENFYMNKIAVGKEVLDKANISINDPIETTVKVISYRLGRQITICMLDRPRHEQLVVKLRKAGCRIRFIQDCDVSAAIAAALPESGIDLFVGIGGAPEGVISAAAVKCLGGHFEGQLVDNKTYLPIDQKVYTAEMLAKGDVMFAATGIVEGSLLKGIRPSGKGVVTHSILMESATKSLKRVQSYYEH